MNKKEEVRIDIGNDLQHEQEEFYDVEYDQNHKFFDVESNDHDHDHPHKHHHHQTSHQYLSVLKIPDSTPNSFALPKPFFLKNPNNHDHSYGHGHSHAHAHAHEDRSSHCINPVLRKKLVLAVAILSAISFLVCEGYTEGTILGDLMEALVNVVHSGTGNVIEAYEVCSLTFQQLPVTISSYVASFIAHGPIVATMIMRWASGGEHNHEHKLITRLFEFLLTGSTSGLNSASSTVSFLNAKFSSLPILYKSLIATFTGLTSAYWNYQLHIFVIHQAIEENSEGKGLIDSVKGFFKGIVKTYGSDIWKLREQHELLICKIRAVGVEAFIRYGLVVGHCFIGKFASDLSSDVFGLNPSVRLTLNVVFPILMMVEAFGEAAIKVPAKLKYPILSPALVHLSAALHNMPATVSMVNLIGKNSKGPCDGFVYNLLVLTALSVTMGLAMQIGSYRYTIAGCDNALTKLHELITTAINLCSRKKGYEELDHNNDVKLSVLSQQWKKRDHTPKIDFLSGATTSYQHAGSH